MNCHFWTPKETERLLKLHSSGYPCREIGLMLQRTEANVRRKLLSLGFSSRLIRSSDIEQQTFIKEDDEVSVPLPSSGSEPLDVKAALAASKELWREGEQQASSETNQIALEDRVLEELIAHWEKSPPELGTIRHATSVPRASGNVKPSCAVVLIGDTHIGKTVDPNEVPFPRSYHPMMAVQRTAHLESRVTAVLEQNPVEELYVVFLGDMVEGHLGQPHQPYLTPPVALQFDLALNLFWQFLLRLSAHALNLRVYGVTGNHGRMLGERKMPVAGRWNNFDGLLYRALNAAATAANATHIHFDPSICSRMLIQTPHHLIQAQHGDEVRGGAYSVDGVNKEYLHATMRNFYIGDKPPDIMVLGHKHIAAQLPIGTGQCIFNGSFVGIDAYSMNFPPCRPSQTLLFLYPDRMETHLIYLDQLPNNSEIPYHFKPDIERLLNSSLS